MRKVLTVVFCAAICLALGSTGVLAGESCGAAKNIKSTSASAVNATSAKADCAGHPGGSVFGALGDDCTPEECAQWAEICKGYDGKCETVALSITGMTCGGCESNVTSSLADIEGVIKVLKVSHKAGAALVCIDPTKLTDKSVLTNAVAQKGFKADFYLANATTNVSAKSASSCAKSCTPAQMKACGAKAGGAKTADASEDKDSETN